MKFKTAQQYLEYLAVRMVVCLLQLLPVGACPGAARWVAWLMHDVLGVRRRVVLENLQGVFPDWSDRQRHVTARRTWEHLFLMVYEIAQAQRKIGESNWRQHIKIPGVERIVGYLLEPRPVLLVSGHFGNFEMAAYAAGLLGFPTFTMVRPVANPFIDRYVRQFRESKGQFVLPKEGSAAAVQRVLEAGESLAIVGDQSAGANGCWINFLGRPASCHKSIALFTLTAAAPMLIMYARRTSGPLQFELGCSAVADPRDLPSELNDVRGLTQWYNDRLEALIRVTPDQYWWIHKRWKDKPERKRGAKKLAA